MYGSQTAFGSDKSMISAYFPFSNVSPVNTIILAMNDQKMVDITMLLIQNSVFTNSDCYCKSIQLGL